MIKKIVFAAGLLSLLAMLLLFSVAGCSEQQSSSVAKMGVASPAYDATKSESSWKSPQNSGGLIGKEEEKSSGGRGDAGGIEPESSIQDGALDKKIIYTAMIRLVTEDFGAFPAELSRLARAAGGFIAETDVARMQGAQRNGRWVVRVPGDKYLDFIRDVSGLGIPESVNEKADDVTEQFVDLDARITSSRRLEEQIIKLLEKQDDKIENVLAVERELSRVRLEIEQLEGSLRFLANQVAMSTITIHASEQRTYIPDQAQTLGQRIEITWHRAVERFQNFLTNSVVLIVANAFVIPAWIIGLTLFWYLIGRRIRDFLKSASLNAQ